jgi:hypothetical protein
MDFESDWRSSAAWGLQGGLVRDDIFLIGERVTRLLNRIKKWVRLASTPVAERKLGILLYGFPPGVGAIGTAALMNVPKSLEQCLQALRAEVCLACSVFFGMLPAFVFTAADEICHAILALPDFRSFRNCNVRRL